MQEQHDIEQLIAPMDQEVGLPQHQPATGETPAQNLVWPFWKSKVRAFVRCD